MVSSSLLFVLDSRTRKTEEEGPGTTKRVTNQSEGAGWEVLHGGGWEWS